jgi:lipid II:glycine glycyltransferase (peptidoglycan interpeptide bridge formation enzyme)
LPPFDYFLQQFHYSITNWASFFWKGFDQTTRYTFVLEDLGDLNTVWQCFRGKIRTHIRKADKQLTIRTDLGIDGFLDLNEMVFERQGLALPYARDLVRRLDRACAERKCRQIFFAQDSTERLHAAVYLVWDDQSAYYLMGGADPELRSSSAMSYLLWEAIQFASRVTSRFDFEGSMIPSVERFFRAFGAKQVPYFRITKCNSISYQIYQDVRSWARKLRDKVKTDPTH